MKKHTALFLSGLSLILILTGCNLNILPTAETSGTEIQAQFAQSGYGWDAQRYGDILDIGTRIRYQDSDPDSRAIQDAKIRALAETTNFDVDSGSSTASDGDFTYDGGTKLFLGYDALNGFYFKEYTLRSMGTSVEIWVANDLSYQDDRPLPIITQNQVDTLRNEFDAVIHPTNTDFFGSPNSHRGENALLSEWGYVDPNYYAPEDGIERIMVMVDNVRDEQYYDSTYPFFIAGFYSGSFESYFDRNMVSLDSKSWETRLESTFFGTLAHEYQHLIHDDNDSDEESWVNEGMSDFAEYLCGYGHPMGHVNFFLDHPENSLVEWDDHYNAETGPETLADYGQAYLLQLYMYDKFGADYIQTLAKNPLGGMQGINDTLSTFNIDLDFEEIFRRFSLALVVDSYRPGRGIYEFDSIDLQVNFEKAKEFEKEGVPAWGANYIEIEDAWKYALIEIDGIQYLASPWTITDDPLVTGNNVFWGNSGNELSNKLIFYVDLRGQSTASLSFDNFIDIEEQWDFGFVQVSTDKGQSWTSLANANTRDDLVADGYPAISDNLPGFTGHYENWVTEEFDLSDYAGQEVYIMFNYMTDWNYLDTGWYIDNISIPEIGFFQDGNSMDDVISYDQLLDRKVLYQVSFVNEIEFPNKSFYRVRSLDPFSVDDDSTEEIRSFFRHGNNYMVVWYPAPDGVKGTVKYEYRLISWRELARREWEKQWRVWKNRFR